MGRIKSLCTVVLAASMIVGSAFSSLADDFNGAGDGDYTGSSTHEHVAVLSNYHYNQGFRTYLVNEKGVPVSNLVDFVKYRPWDITVLKQAGQAETGERIDLMWDPYFNRTGIWDNPGGDVYKEIKYIGGAKTDTWRVSNSAGTGKIYKDGRTPGGAGVFSIKRDTFNGDESADEVYTEDGKMYTLSILYTQLKNDIESDSYAFPFDGSHTKSKYVFNGKEYEIFNYMPAAIESLDGHLVLTGTALKNMMMRPLDIEHYGVDQSLVVQYFVNLYLPNVDGLGNPKDGGELVPLFDIQDKEIEAYFKEATENFKGLSEAEQKKIVNPMRDTMNKFKLKVAFEPITWQVPSVAAELPSVKQNKFGYYWTDNKIVYGTVTNVAQYISEEVNKWTKTQFEDCPDRNMDYSGWLNWLNKYKYGLGWAWGYPQKAYHLEREMYGLNAFNVEDEQSLAVLAGFWDKLGYGVMYFGTSIEEAGAFTSTYDKTQNTPAPSPGNTNEDGTFPSEYPSEGEEYSRLNKDHARNIVKFYSEKQPDGSYVYEENHVRERTVSTINIEDELEYKVDSYFTSPVYKAPTNPSDSYDDWKNTLPKGEFEGHTTGQIKITPESDDSTLYLRLVKEKPQDVEDPDSAKLILHENELAHTFNLSDLSSLLEVRHSFSDHSESGSGKHKSDEDSWYCDWERYLEDDRYGYSISNKQDYASTTFIGAQGVFAPKEDGTVADSGTASIHGTVTNGLTPNLRFSVYRDKEKDNVTLYKGKNEQGIADELAQIGITSQSYEAGKKRVDTQGNGGWSSTFLVNYTYDENDNTLSWDSSGCSRHGDSGSYSGSENIGLEVINSLFSGENNVFTKYELGKPNKGIEVPKENADAFSLLGREFRNQRWTKVIKGENIEFYPYINMIYEDIDRNQKEAKVVSENMSELANIQVIDTGVSFDSAKPTVEIGSTQWSTHTRAITGLRENNVKDAELNRSLLPGGAVYDLKSKNGGGDASEVWLGLRVYQVTIPDEQMEKLARQDGVNSTSKAKADIEATMNQIKETVEHYQLVQWADTGIYTDEAAFKNSSSKKLVSGPKSSNTFGGNSLSSDSKYYLKTDGTGANRADIDIINERKEQHIWRIQNDTDGNVWILKDGQEVVRDNINKSRSIQGLLVNEELSNLENKTNIISNYVKALDFKLGADRNGNVWYTEAFDGVEIVETGYAVQVGLGGDAPIRAAVLDPKLTGELDNKSDILNFKSDTLKQKTRTFQYRTSYRSTLPEAQSKPNGWIADLGGEEIILRGMDNVLRSKLWYTGNSTVMDLN